MFSYSLFWTFSLFAALLFKNEKPQNNLDEKTKKAYICIAKEKF